MPASSPGTTEESTDESSRAEPAISSIARSMCGCWRRWHAVDRGMRESRRVRRTRVRRPWQQRRLLCESPPLATSRRRCPVSPNDSGARSGTVVEVDVPLLGCARAADQAGGAVRRVHGGERGVRPGPRREGDSSGRILSRLTREGRWSWRSMATWATAIAIAGRPGEPRGQEDRAGEPRGRTLRQGRQAGPGACRALGSRSSRRIVVAESVRQALLYVQNGNAEAGLVGRAIAGVPEVRAVEVDQALYDPIVQALGIVADSSRQTDGRGLRASSCSAKRGRRS